MVDGTLKKLAGGRTFAALGALALAVATAGCAHVSQDDFEAEIAQVRAEMQAGDQGVETRLSERVDALDQRMDALEAQLRALEDELDMEIERLEASLRVYTPVYFGFDSATLDGESTDALERLSAVLAEYYPTALVTVEGFADPAGSAAYNLRLGQRRADAVSGWLVSEGGLPEPQVRAVSYGEATERLVRPGESGPGPEGRENRRVVVVIDHPDDAAASVVAQGGA